ncbi:MAG: hypothetical protein GY799_21310 [Desulfobulbaceae bacterium]|nr:hypothetical protein [Desulfobulbaceae bacterium]
MIHYLDRVFCDSYKDCKAGEGCPSAFTPKVKADADDWWGKPGAPIAVYVGTPSCWEEKVHIVSVSYKIVDGGEGFVDTSEACKKCDFNKGMCTRLGIDNVCGCGGKYLKKV